MLGRRRGPGRATAGARESGGQGREPGARESDGEPSDSDRRRRASLGPPLGTLGLAGTVRGRDRIAAGPSDSDGGRWGWQRWRRGRGRAKAAAAVDVASKEAALRRRTAARGVLIHVLGSSCPDVPERGRGRSRARTLVCVQSAAHHVTPRRKATAPALYRSESAFALPQRVVAGCCSALSLLIPPAAFTSLPISFFPPPTTPSTRF